MSEVNAISVATAIAKKYGVRIVENNDSAHILLPSGARITLASPINPHDIDEVLEFLGRKDGGVGK